MSVYIEVKIAGVVVGLKTKALVEKMTLYTHTYEGKKLKDFV